MTDFQEISEVSASLEDIYMRGRIDINFFASLCIPEVCIYDLPDFYCACFQLLTNRKEVDVGKLLRFALGLPRGHAKTTFIKILIVWLIVYDQAKFILIVCANAPLAELLLSDIHDILKSDNIRVVYGDWEGGLSTDSSDTKKSRFHDRSIILVARGWKGGIRGINLKHSRPDVIFLDDVQTKENSESETESKTLLSELIGTIFKALTPLGNKLIIYVGNMYSDHCILAQFKKNPGWISMITGAILTDCKPLWPELFSLEALMESYYHDEALGMAHVWFAEIMNDPTNTAQSIFPNPLPDCPIPEHDFTAATGAFITIDPAGFRKTSDENVIVVHLRFENCGVIVETVKGILDPEQIITQALSLAIKWRCSLICIEDTGYQMTLAFWMNKYIVQYSLSDLVILPVSPHGRHKESRIRLFIKDLYAENYYIHDPVTRRDFTWQASMYKVGKPNNRDDLLDACAYGQDVRNEYWQHISFLDHGITIEGTCRVIPNNTPF